mmetsp:Transcript_19301/g.41712  ORF Transcript_19301/g.41712 Transcript_19301/m.41712 type:complete len:332 (+) Transcript_19301:127-1122(+)
MAGSESDGLIGHACVFRTSPAFLYKKNCADRDGDQENRSGIANIKEDTISALEKLEKVVPWDALEPKESVRVQQLLTETRTYVTILAESTQNNIKERQASGFPESPKLGQWVPDDEQSRCFGCKDPFTLFRRRHHCRNCGRIFCNPCSGRRIPLGNIGYTQPVRVCNVCFSSISAAAKSERLEKSNKTPERAPVNSMTKQVDVLEKPTGLAERRVPLFLSELKQQGSQSLSCTNDREVKALRSGVGSKEGKGTVLDELKVFLSSRKVVSRSVDVEAFDEQRATERRCELQARQIQGLLPKPDTPIANLLDQLSVHKHGAEELLDSDWDQPN